MLRGMFEPVSAGSAATWYCLWSVLAVKALNCCSCLFKIMWLCSESMNEQ